MAENACPTCSGKGKLQEQVLKTPGGRFAPIATPKFIKCEVCGGSGERKH